VNDDVRKGYVQLYPVLDPLGKGMGFVDMKLSARKEVKIYVFITPGTTGPQFVKPGNREGHPVDDILDLALYFVGEARIHDARDAAAEDLHRRKDDYQSGSGGKDEVKEGDMRVIGKRDSDDRPRVRIEIAPVMERVGLERIRTGAVADPQEGCGYDETENKGKAHGEEIEEGVGYGPFLKEGVHRLVDDERSRQDDHQGLEGARKVLGLAVTVSMLVVGGFGCLPDGLEVHG